MGDKFLRRGETEIVFDGKEQIYLLFFFEIIYLEIIRRIIRNCVLNLYKFIKPRKYFSTIRNYN